VYRLLTPRGSTLILGTESNRQTWTECVSPRSSTALWFIQLTLLKRDGFMGNDANDVTRGRSCISYDTKA
jgi:hypothetical protein